MTALSILTHSDTIDIVGQMISRSQMESTIAQAIMPLVFESCDFEGVDLSRLNMSGFLFKGCTFMASSLYAAVLTQTTWFSCRGRQADFEEAELVDAKF